MPRKRRRSARGDVWWPPSLLATCQQAAKNAGLDFSVWLRIAAAEKAGIPPDPDDARRADRAHDEQQD